MNKIVKIFERSGYLRAAASLQRLGYPEQAKELRKQASNLGNH